MKVTSFRERCNSVNLLLLNRSYLLNLKGLMFSRVYSCYKFLIFTLNKVVYYRYQMKMLEDENKFLFRKIKV